MAASRSQKGHATFPWDARGEQHRPRRALHRQGGSRIFQGSRWIAAGMPMAWGVQRVLQRVARYTAGDASLRQGPQTVQLCVLRRREPVTGCRPQAGGAVSATGGAIRRASGNRPHRYPVV